MKSVCSAFSRPTSSRIWSQMPLQNTESFLFSGDASIICAFRSSNRPIGPEINFLYTVSSAFSGPPVIVAFLTESLVST